MSNEEFYIVKYSRGIYDEYREYNVFITSSISLAHRWCEKANQIKDKWFKYYDKITEELSHEDSDFANHIHHRFNQVTDYGVAWVEKIERR